MNSRILQIDGVRNVRDLGGIINRDGKVLKRGSFIRTGNLNSITEVGNKKIENLNINTVIDLRSKVEVEKRPDKVKVKHHFWMPMLDKFQSEIAKNKVPMPTALNDMYIALLKDQEEEFKKIFNVISNSIEESGVLYHCTAGKDRTGILSMLLLSTANVGYDEIIQDYATTKPLQEVLEKYPEDIRFLFYAPPEAMESTLNWIDKNYSGPMGYLNKIGVKERELDIIRKSFGVF